MSGTEKAYSPPPEAAAPELQRLADACGRGEAEAMLLLAKYIIEKYPKADKAARMWLLRAAIYGNAAAQRYVREAMAQDCTFLRHCMLDVEMFLPGKRTDHYMGNYSGAMLNSIGLLAFPPEGRYIFSGLNENRIRVIREEVDYDPPDEDGFGAETYYDMFCLDEYFQPLPGVPEVHYLTSSDVRGGKYQSMLSAAALAVRDRSHATLWTEFMADH